MKESKEKCKILKNLGWMSRMLAKKMWKRKKILAKHLICEQRKCEKDKISSHKRPEVSKEKGEKANFLCKGLETDVVHV